MNVWTLTDIHRYIHTEAYGQTDRCRQTHKHLIYFNDFYRTIVMSKISDIGGVGKQGKAISHFFTYCISVHATVLKTLLKQTYPHFPKKITPTSFL